MAGKMDSINISRASSTTNLFYLFFHGGKAAIVPFLTLFFRLVGLNAFEVGTVIAVKTLTSLVWAPLWAKCATAYSRHRLVLVMSLFMMIMTYLAFPALYTQLSSSEHCLQVSSSNHSGLPLDDASAALPDTVNPTTQMSAATSGTSSFSPSTGSGNNFGQTTAQRIQQSMLESTTPRIQESTLESTTPRIPESTLEAATPRIQETTFEINTAQPWSASETKLTDASVLSPRNGEPILYETFLGILHKLNITLQEYFNAKITPQELADLLLSNDQNLQITEEQVKRSADDHAMNRRDWMSQLTDKLHTVQSSLKNDRLLLFLIILGITVGGEIFSCPVEKVADDSWFDFLNRIDDLERYGQQRFWGSIAFVVIPIVVTVAVDYTPCFLFYNVHHFMIHFYLFAVLAGGAMIAACCYPVPPPANGKYASKITKGLHIICCDARGFLFSVTLLLTGMVYASHHNFLFWRIQDLGGGETPMGLCVSFSAFAEIPMLILSGRLVKKLGQSWVVCISVFTLSVRVLYYAFISQPWAFIPMELTHGITHTALWFAILSYDDFNVGAAIDRSIRSILSSFYFGVGFSAGSLVSGYIYYTFGSSVLFWGCSAVTIGWCLLFSVIQKCLPQKEKVRYIKLLRSDSDNSDDEEDDWLEMALKKS
ncbi:unnamed protein product [Candidula unifasciata]|uniref:Major facilitator superfamily associated domain-containing protein n=1 Tax=Candidula unifasciata TaxID=100452 RepID=A0A8S3ZIC6_9EUPU|nr:unnamed protein product [Candidula unifasciata]